MNNIKEKISALYDGELNLSEIDDLLETINSDPKLQEHLSLYGLAGFMLSENKKKVASLDFKIEKNKSIFSNLWISNGLTAAASILLTFFIISNLDISRMNISTESTNQIALAVNSKEAKDIAQKSEEYLIDHILNIINDPNYMNSQESIDLRNVGFRHNTVGGYGYSKGSENFKIRIEKKNLGIKKTRYWKHGKKMIYVVPLSDGRVVTLYGNISASSARTIAESLTK
ncbi:MAG: hypothetical protein CMD46_00265 [Gammaproteobacteria bacterium]|mgnify:CR=1 FL=1|nr:hypothetical protein [Gammaproteobacteria bacterium]|tara:strand:- start:8612 stop:9298 length:687 start_codon:yes stop_codon:yes gene_type:complete